MAWGDGTDSKNGSRACQIRSQNLQQHHRIAMPIGTPISQYPTARTPLWSGNVEAMNTPTLKQMTKSWRVEYLLRRVLSCSG